METMLNQHHTLPDHLTPQEVSCWLTGFEGTLTLGRWVRFEALSPFYGEIIEIKAPGLSDDLIWLNTRVLSGTPSYPFETLTVLPQTTMASLTTTVSPENTERPAVPPSVEDPIEAPSLNFILPESFEETSEAPRFIPEPEEEELALDVEEEMPPVSDSEPQFVDEQTADGLDQAPLLPLNEVFDGYFDLEPLTIALEESPPTEKPVDLVYAEESSPLVTEEPMESPLPPLLPTEERPKEEPLPESPIEYTAGERIHHEKYGSGIITKVIPMDNSIILNVQFESVGKRLLDPTLVPLEKIAPVAG